MVQACVPKSQKKGTIIMIMKIIRSILTPILLFIDFISRPKPIERSTEKQSIVDEAAKHFQLYQFTGCPFCIRVRREAHRLNISLMTQNVQNDPDLKKELLELGGNSKVPCLRMEEDGKIQWMYESKKINQYFNERFGMA